MKKNVHHVSIITPSSLYRLNKSEFSKNYKWFNSYYKDCINKEKILILLEYWLYGLRVIIELYGIENAKKYCSDNKVFCPIQFSWMEEYNVDIRSADSGIKSRLIYELFSTFINRYTTAGAPIYSILDKIRSRISKIVILSVPMVVVESKRSTLVGKLLDMLNCNRAGDFERYLNNGLPALFYADQVNVKFKRNDEIVLEGAMTSLMEFNGSENILLFDQRVQTLGRQHGGGYGSYHDEYAKRYELKLSDNFIGWGLAKNNERQHRYPKRRSYDNFKLQRFIWVERSKMPRLYQYMHQAYYSQVKNLSAISCIYRALVQEKIEYLNLSYVGKGKSDLYENYRMSLLSSTGFGEFSLRGGDVVIFDSFVSSLMYYCIVNRHTFICVTSHEDVSLFTKSNRLWFDMLYKYGFAFYDNEKDSIANRIKIIKTDKPKVPKEIIEYHHNNFFIS